MFERMKNQILLMVAATMLFSCSMVKEKGVVKPHTCTPVKEQSCSKVEEHTCSKVEEKSCSKVEEQCCSKAEQKTIVKLHEGYYAFCGASGAVPTGDSIMVQGEMYAEGYAVCPVFSDTSISNLAMHGVSTGWGDVMGTEGQFNVEKDFEFPGSDGSTRWDGKSVWSLYHYFDTSTAIPQFNPATMSWEMMKPSNRAFIVDTDYPYLSESNMFCMPCQIIDTTESGIVLAKCFGPLNEAAVPLRKAIPVKSGMESITAAIPGKPYPVGTPVPLMKLGKDLQNKNK